jgi:hypothetical protein
MATKQSCFDPILSALSFVWKVAKEVRERIQAMSENKDLCRSIEDHVNILENIANDLKIQLQKLDELPETWRNDCIIDFNVTLEKCRGICVNFRQEGGFKKFFKVHGHRRNLNNLDSELKRATDTLQLVLSQIKLAQGEAVGEAVRQGMQEVRGDILHPNRGVYLTNSEKDGPKPCQLECPQVSLDDDSMKIKWIDDRNPKKKVIRYEVQYDEQNNLILPLTVKECRLKEDPNAFCVKLGPPRVKAGTLYTIRVRCINKSGPGEWSKATVFRFKSGPPKKPYKPTVTIQSHTEVLITVKRPPLDDENGSPITCCKVEYIKKGGNDSTWSTKQLDMSLGLTGSSFPADSANAKQSHVKIGIPSLTPDTAYCFRIKMMNKVGESIPSDPCDIIITQLIPGPPQNVRISSKRRDTTLKVRWQEPFKNPQSVYQYKVQTRMANKKSEWMTRDAVGEKCRSAKVQSLETDTKYEFRVQAINRNEAGEWSNTVEAETRFGVFGRAVGVAGVFVVGVVGGPAIGAVGFGAMAAAAAKNKPDRETAKKAAELGAGVGAGVGGAAVGLIGAPIIGGMAAAIVNKKLAGEIDISPQSSDDENEPESLLTKIGKVVFGEEKK